MDFPPGWRGDRASGLPHRFTAAGIFSEQGSSVWQAVIVIICLSSLLHSQVAGTPGPTPTSASPHRQAGIVQLQQGQLQQALNEFQAALAENPSDAISHDYVGVILGEEGNLSNALVEFAQAVRIDSTLPEPHFHLGLAYERVGRTNDAIAEYHEALRLNPAMQEARYGLSEICAKIGDLDGAIFLLQQVIHAAPEFAEAHYNLGLNLWNRYKSSTGLKQSSDLDSAAQELKTAVQQQPQPPAYFALGQILADRGDSAAAVENLQKATELDPSNDEYHYTLGLALRLKGDMDSAAAQFREAIRLNPGHALAHRSLGLMLREQGDWEAASAELHLAVAQLPNDAEGRHLLGTMLFKLNELAAAIEEFRKAVILNPYLAEAHASLAKALQKAGQKDEAERELSAMRAINTEKANAGRAMVLVETAERDMKNGQLTAAVTDLREAVSLSPNFIEGQYQLGLALRPHSNAPVSHASWENTSANSEAAFYRVLQLNPNHAAAHLQLGLLFQARGEIAKATSELEKAEHSAPGLVEAHLALARLAAVKKDWEKAITQLDAALAWDPANAGAHYELATALRASGRGEDAAHEFEIVARLAPRLQLRH
jgi:tetratricopeptide (TPR) repeat protein